MAMLQSLCFTATTPFQTSSSSAYRPSSAALSLSLSISTTHLVTSLKLQSFHCHCSPSPSASASSVVELEQVNEEEAGAAASGGSGLVAQNVPWSCTAEDVRALFEKYGTVVDVELSMHNKSRNRGLAFVTMGSPEEALATLNNLEGFEYEGRVLNIAYAKKKKPRSPPASKPVSLYNLLSRNCHTRASGYGFVSFGSKEAAEAALTAFDGEMFLDRPIRVARSKRFAKQAAPPKAKQESPSSSDTGASQHEGAKCEYSERVIFNPV